MNIGWVHYLLGWHGLIMTVAASHYCQTLFVTRLAGTTLKKPGLIPAEDRFFLLQCLMARIHELVPCLLQAASPQNQYRLYRTHIGTASRTSAHLV